MPRLPLRAKEQGRDRSQVRAIARSPQDCRPRFDSTAGHSIIQARVKLLGTSAPAALWPTSTFHLWVNRAQPNTKENDP